MKRLRIGMVIAALAMGAPMAWASDDTPMCGNEPRPIPGLPQRLLFWDADRPEEIYRTVELAGLDRLEEIMSIDYSEAAGGLVGVSRTGALYLIDPSTGETRRLSARLPAFATADGGSFEMLDRGFWVSGPIPDPWRIGFGERANVEVRREARLRYVGGIGDPDIAAVAGARLDPDPQPWRLFGIDATAGTLVSIDRATGLVSTVGPLGDPVTDGAVGFDMVQVQEKAAPGIWKAYAVWKPIIGPGPYCFYAVDYFSGKATPIGALGGLVTPMAQVRDIAALPLRR